MPYTSAVIKAMVAKTGVCTQELGEPDYMDRPTPKPVERKQFDKKTEKKCIKCKNWLKKDEFFGKHDTSSDGYQSICKTCKKEANKTNLAKNVKARIRHHIATRCLDQLKGHVPSKFTRDLDGYLGYNMTQLVKHLREDLKAREGADRSLKDALNEGYHIDHIYPLSRYPVVVDGAVDWATFRECWAIKNLSAIPAVDNLKKGAKIIDLGAVDV